MVRIAIDLTSEDLLRLITIRKLREKSPLIQETQTDEEICKELLVKGMWAEIADLKEQYGGRD